MASYDKGYERGMVSITDDAYEEDDFEEKRTVAELPHQCGSWVIGNQEQVRMLIADLQRLLEEWPDAK